MVVGLFCGLCMVCDVMPLGVGIVKMDEASMACEVSILQAWNALVVSTGKNNPVTGCFVDILRGEMSSKLNELFNSEVFQNKLERKDNLRVGVVFHLLKCLRTRLPGIRRWGADKIESFMV